MRHIMQARYLFLAAVPFFHCSLQQAMDRESTHIVIEGSAYSLLMEQVKEKQSIGEITNEIAQLQCPLEALVNAEKNMRALLQEIDDKPGWPKVLSLKRDIFKDSKELQAALTLLHSSAHTDDSLIIKISSPSECIELFIALHKVRNSIVYQGRQQEAISCEHFIETLQKSHFYKFYLALSAVALCLFVVSRTNILGT
jgi:hypothetical protein